MSVDMDNAEWQCPVNLVFLALALHELGKT